MIGHIEEGRRIDKAVCGSAQTFAIRGVELVDARGVIPAPSMRQAPSMVISPRTLR